MQRWIRIKSRFSAREFESMGQESSPNWNEPNESVCRSSFYHSD